MSINQCYTCSYEAQDTKLCAVTMHTGVLLLLKGNKLVAFRQDWLHGDCSDLENYPGVGKFDLSPVIRRSSTAVGLGQGQRDDRDLLALLDDAAGLVKCGSVVRLRRSPFKYDESTGEHIRPNLLDVLEQVSCRYVTSAVLGGSLTAGSNACVLSWLDV